LHRLPGTESAVNVAKRFGIGVLPTPSRFGERLQQDKLSASLL
jgi:hypothetical protein